jgi:zinc D-Ala-D-Ala dipeptidase
MDGFRYLIAVVLLPLAISCTSIPMSAHRFPVSKNKTLAASNLIEVREVDRSIQVELIYKTSDNLTRSPLYPKEMSALLRPETAQRLARANEEVKGQGFQIKIWDAYRPPEAQFALWDACGHNDRYVANPHHKPSQHSCGTAVDVTLVRPDGSAVKMPTSFDDFTPAAASGAISSDPEARAHLKILQDAMKNAGFMMLAAEWWHFIDGNYQSYPDVIEWKEIQHAF